jgi:hypothetical protein
MLAYPVAAKYDSTVNLILKVELTTFRKLEKI